jgi:hypothetical protein
MYKNGATIPGRAALSDWLIDRHYSCHARWAISEHIEIHGTLEGSMVEPDDMAEATEVYISALPPIDYDNPCWDKEDFYLDCEMLEAGTHPWPFVHEDDDRREFPDFDDAMDALEAECGPLPEPGRLYDPTAEDLTWLRDREVPYYGYE